MFCPSRDWKRERTGFREVRAVGRRRLSVPGKGSYQFRVLGGHAVGVLQQRLELAVLGEGDDLQHDPELGEDLQREERRTGVNRATE